MAQANTTALEARGEICIIDVLRVGRRHWVGLPNQALEATGHRGRFWAGMGLYGVARASAWALGAFGVEKNTMLKQRTGEFETLCGQTDRR